MRTFGWDPSELELRVGNNFTLHKLYYIEVFPKHVIYYDSIEAHIFFGKSYSLYKLYKLWTVGASCICSE